MAKRPAPASSRGIVSLSTAKDVRAAWRGVGVLVIAAVRLFLAILLKS